MIDCQEISNLLNVRASFSKKSKTLILKDVTQEVIVGALHNITPSVQTYSLSSPEETGGITLFIEPENDEEFYPVKPLDIQPEVTTKRNLQDIANELNANIVITPDESIFIGNAIIFNNDDNSISNVFPASEEMDHFQDMIFNGGWKGLGSENNLMVGCLSKNLFENNLKWNEKIIKPNRV